MLSRFARPIIEGNKVWVESFDKYFPKLLTTAYKGKRDLGAVASYDDMVREWNSQDIANEISEIPDKRGLDENVLNASLSIRNFLKKNGVNTDDIDDDYHYLMTLPEFFKRKKGFLCTTGDAHYDEKDSWIAQAAIIRALVFNVARLMTEAGTPKKPYLNIIGAIEEDAKHINDRVADVDAMLLILVLSRGADEPDVPLPVLNGMTPRETLKAMVGREDIIEWRESVADIKSIMDVGKAIGLKRAYRLGNKFVNAHELIDTLVELASGKRDDELESLRRSHPYIDELYGEFTSKRIFDSNETIDLKKVFDLAVAPETTNRYYSTLEQIFGSHTMWGYLTFIGVQNTPLESMFLNPHSKENNTIIMRLTEDARDKLYRHICPIDDVEKGLKMMEDTWTARGFTDGPVTMRDITADDPYRLIKGLPYERLFAHRYCLNSIDNPNAWDIEARLNKELDELDKLQ